MEVKSATGGQLINIIWLGRKGEGSTGNVLTSNFTYYQSSVQRGFTVHTPNRCGGGVEVEVWSHLPQGSGLGGSSLVAGTLVAAVAALLGHPLPSHTTLIHATLCIEQWLTTGGGWQDQVCIGVCLLLFSPCMSLEY